MGYRPSIHIGTLEKNKMRKALKEEEWDYIIHLAAFGGNGNGLLKAADEDFNKALNINVTGFTKDLGRCMSVPIVTAAIAYDHEYTGETSIIVIHNALYFKSMENNLIPPFAIRMSGAEVNEEAKFLAKEPTINHHSIYWPININKHQQELRIPLQLHGTISYFPARIPHQQEVKDN